MESVELLNQLNGLFRDFLDDDSLNLARETTADDVEDWTSLNHLQIIVSIESHFKIKFNHKEVSNLGNIGELCDLIASKLE